MLTEKWYTGSTLERTLTFTYDAAGQLTAAGDSESTAPDYAYVYDNLGRLITSTMTAGGMSAQRKLESVVPLPEIFAQLESERSGVMVSSNSRGASRGGRVDHELGRSEWFEWSGTFRCAA